MNEANSKWSECLLGYFIEGNNQYHVVNNIAHKIWDKEVFLSLRFYHMKADSTFEDLAMKKLSAPFWRQVLGSFAGRPLILRMWHPKLILIKGSNPKIPLWVKFHSIPVSLWSASGFNLLT